METSADSSSNSTMNTQNPCDTPHFSYSQGQYQILKEATSSTPMFTLDGTRCIGKVVNVYDGDTLRIAMYLHDFSDGTPTTIRQFIVRMVGYDCPELRTKNLKEKEFGYRSKEIFSRMVQDRIVFVECGEMDKYGRLLAVITAYSETHGFINMNHFMVDNHLGVNYEGATKTTFDSLYESGYYRMEDVPVITTVDYPFQFIASNIEIPNGNVATDLELTQSQINLAEVSIQNATAVVQNTNTSSEKQGKLSCISGPLQRIKLLLKRNKV